MQGSQRQSAVEFDSVTIRRGNVTLLDQVSATVPLNSCTAIVGPNGAGKTTLVLALLGEIPFRGSIRTSPSFQSRRPEIGYLPQRFAFDRAIPVTVTEFLLMGLQKRALWLGMAAAHQKRALELLDLVGAQHLAHRAIGALSGGEMQRLLLALALQHNPELLVLDEPAAGVDFQGEHLFCELLDRLRSSLGFTQLMVSHDLATVTHHADHVICLNRQVAAEGPPHSTLTPENLQAVFGLHMGLVDSRSMPEGSTTCSAPCCSEDHNA